MVKQPNQEYMIAQALEPPPKIPPSSPVVIDAVSAHNDICVACQACNAAAHRDEPQAETQQCINAISSQHDVQSVHGDNDPEQADQAASDLDGDGSRSTGGSSGRMGSLEAAVIRVSQGTTVSITAKAGLEASRIANIACYSSSNPPDSQQHQEYGDMR